MGFHFAYLKPRSNPKLHSYLMKLSILRISIIILFFFMAACEIEQPQQSTEASEDSQSESNQPPRNPLEPTEAIQLVYLGSAGCNFCTDEETIEKINFIKNRLEEVAEYLGYQIWFSGIAADEDPVVGYEHLKMTWPYHEINTGAYYYNWGHMEYIWGEGEFAGPGVVPQMLINRSTYRIEAAGMSIGNAFREEQLIQRYTGAQDITQLYEVLSEEDMDGIAEKLGLINLLD